MRVYECAAVSIEDTSTIPGRTKADKHRPSRRTLARSANRSALFFGLNDSER